MKKIHIAGGGIAGMSAAIYLSKKSVPVTIFEKRSNIGQSRHGDYEGLENWIFDENTPLFFKNIGFDLSKINLHPISEFKVHCENKSPLLVRSKKPFFSLVKRGPLDGDFDNQLYQQCKESGVKFRFNVNASDKCDIIATGSRKASAFVRGSSFRTNLKNQVHLLLGEKFSPKGYAYLIIHNGHGTIATAFKKVMKSNNDYLNSCKEYFKKIDIPITDEKDFGSRGSFAFSSGKISKPIRVGEAGGFQDYLFGFGMKMSMMSGYFAGLYMNEEKTNAKLLLKTINKKRRISFLNRVLYERLNDENMYYLAQKFSHSNIPLSILMEAYKWNFKTFFKWLYFKNRYEIRPT